MRKHLLVTISGDTSAMYGVRFFSSFFTNKAETGCTLLYVAPNPSAALSMSELHRDMENVLKQTEELRRKGDAALERARDYLVQAGFPAQNVSVKLGFRQRSTALDIIDEGVKGMYDAIVMGRRGLSRLEELVQDSVSRVVATTRMEIPIWISHTPDADRANVLLCVDGSDQSLRAADHVGFVLADEPGHTVRLYHIWDPAKEDLLEAQDIIDQAREVLLSNGLPEGRISQQIDRGTASARRIVHEAEKGGYAVIAVGRSGADRPFMGVFMGSVSLSLLRSLGKSALWVSH